MFNPAAFSRAIARSKEKRAKQKSHTNHVTQTVITPINIVDTNDKAGLSVAERDEQYRVTTINNAIAYIKTNKPKGKSL